MKATMEDIDVNVSPAPGRTVTPRSAWSRHYTAEKCLASPEACSSCICTDRTLKKVMDVPVLPRCPGVSLGCLDGGILDSLVISLAILENRAHQCIP